MAVLHRGRLVRLGKTGELLQSSERTEITARGISADGFAGAVAQDGLVRMVVPRQEQRAIITRIWDAGGEIVSVIPQRRSLEEVFLEVTAEAESGSMKGVQ